jgi:hypothetical protein
MNPSVKPAEEETVASSLHVQEILLFNKKGWFYLEMVQSLVDFNATSELAPDLHVTFSVHFRA